MPDDKVVALVVDIAYRFCWDEKKVREFIPELESLKERTTTTCIQHFKRRSPSTGLDAALI